VPKFIISWDIGYGRSYDEIEAESQEKASQIAYECWREEAEGNAIFDAEPYTEELAEELL